MEIRSLPQYQHSALPSHSCIRLLERLDSATAEGHLTFRVHTRSVDEPGPSYHCLSYTWGNPFAHGNGFAAHFHDVAQAYSPDARIPIVLDGQAFHVHKNLHDALASIPATAYADDLNRHTRDKGQTYLHYIGSQGIAEHVSFYVARGASVHLRDEDGRTALHLAAMGGHAECVHELCKVGSVRGAKDDGGQTAEDLALESGHTQVAAVLRAMAAAADPLPCAVAREKDGAERLIWADAVCINQSDMDEKSTQVGMMDRIYSNAVYVLAWLGPKDEHTDLGLRTADILVKHLDAFKGSRISPWLGHDRDRYAEAGVPHLAQGDWNALASIYQRQWFRRAWVIQEAILSRILLVYVGDRLVPWFDLGTLAQALRHQEARLGATLGTRYEPTNSVGVSVEWNMAEMFQWRTHMGMTQRGTADVAAAHKRLFQLGELVSSFWTFRATDPTDKIFSVYGLINKFTSDGDGSDGGGGGRARHMTDYRRSVESVYTRATRQIIREQGNLEILSNSLHSEGRRGSLPGWVPDYSVPAINPVPNIFAASKGLDFELPPPDQEDDSPQLQVKGLRLGTLSQVSGRQGTRPLEKFIFEPKWLQMVLSLKDLPNSQTRPPLAELLWRTLCMDMSYGGFFSASDYGGTAPDEYRDQFTSFVLLMLMALADRRVLERNGIDPAASPAAVSMFDVSYDPFSEDLAMTLRDLDAIIARDGDTSASYMPPSNLIVRLWNDVRCTMVRCTAVVGEDDGPYDFDVPREVLEGKNRCVGTGYVCTDSRMFRRCFSFASAYSVALGYRQLVTVNDLYLGVAPLPAEAADEVWILPGLTCPVVLRRMQDEEEDAVFLFIGCCYLHGLMHGQAVEEAKAKGAELVDIVLV
ncbi:HET domain-containing protein [Cordyceps javanica]|uniref:HET domain-containing protein n=1 Tax=Cordyceps javanica TaxID=43265 RepID=A0A545VFM2_9HYPO|nr:HET domain-containing protein [Cordyceps javanica]TQW11717.1 HET domain protein [Cordyceps javanica]